MTNARLSHMPSILSPRPHICPTVDGAARSALRSQPLLRLNDLPTALTLADPPTATPPMAPAASAERQPASVESAEAEPPASALYP